MRQFLFATILLFLGYSAQAQWTEDLKPEDSWDLSYESLLDQNDVKWDHQVGTLFTWLKHRDEEHRYITNFVTAEMSKDPQASFLIDHPTFPSAGRTTVLGIKNNQGCFFYWRSTDEGMEEFEKQSISDDLFRQVTEHLMVMKQKGYESMGGPERAYAGFLSVFRNGISKQILLHINDFMEFDVENQQILRIGKIYEIENSLQVNNK